MVIVQFIDNGKYNFTDQDRDENDYDRLLPLGEFEHLCTCTYSRVNSSDEGSMSGDSHLGTIQM